MLLKIFSQDMCLSCPPAKELGKKLEKEGLVKVELVDVAKPEGLAEAKKHDVMSTPTLVLVDGDKEVKKWVGMPGKGEVREMLTK